MDKAILQVEVNGQGALLHVAPTECVHSLADILARQGYALNTRCGQRGLCEGCVIDLHNGVLQDAQGVTVRGPGQGLKACLLHPVAGASAKIAIPPRSLLAHRPSVADDFRIRIPAAHDPLVPVTRTAPYGIAIDIGTTTVALLLVSLTDGRILAKASGFNRQMHLGDDVLTRIQLCTDPARIGQLQEAISRETLLPLLGEALAKAGATLSQVAVVSVAGNTTMMHLLCGVDPSPMGQLPFTPAFLEARQVTGREVGLPELADIPVQLLPGLAAYVGADLAAGIYATGLVYEEGPALLVDVGTNGEIILRAGSKLYGAATAAGPAFEGAGLSCGVRAVEDAIGHIRLESPAWTVQADRIGGKHGDPLIGLCGSAYIDFLAEGRRVGLLESSGRFNEDFYNSLPADCRVPSQYGRALRLFPETRSHHLLVTEVDIAQLLQAKGAIGAGLVTLLQKAGLSAPDVKTVFLAGGFGMHLNRANAIACGLLPGFREDQIEVVGNTSLAGAYLALLDRQALAEMDRLRATAEIVELNLEPSFEDNYIDQLQMP